MPTRRHFLTGAGIAVIAAGGAAYWWSRQGKVPLGMVLTDTDIAAGRHLLTQVISVDTHAHPGRSFVVGGEHLSTRLKLYSALGSFEADTIEDMRRGGLTTASFATVSDFQLLDFGERGLYAAREFEPGEAWQSYQKQIQRLKELLQQNLCIPVLRPEDITRAKTTSSIGAWLTAEGGDFLEGSLEHLDQAYRDGLRSITLVHYHTNEIGDFQTAAPVHKGLTPFGHQLVSAMNQKGLLVDLAHAAKATAMDAIAASEKPVMVSHSAIRGVRGEGFDFSRFIDLDQARAVAATGGIIGAWPAGLGLSTFADYVDQILRTIDLVGIDHVALGTDMDANYKPVFESYRQLPMLAGALLKRGLSETETAQFLGGNFLRVFREVSA